MHEKVQQTPKTTTKVVCDLCLCIRISAHTHTYQRQVRDETMTKQIAAILCRISVMMGFSCGLFVLCMTFNIMFFARFAAVAEADSANRLMLSSLLVLFYTLLNLKHKSVFCRQECESLNCAKLKSLLLSIRIFCVIDLLLNLKHTLQITL